MYFSNSNSTYTSPNSFSKGGLPRLSPTLSPDPFVQNAANLQNFNRYSYAIGFTGGMVFSNGDWQYSNKSGLFGATIGSIMGSTVGALAALATEYNLFAKHPEFGNEYPGTGAITVAGIPSGSGGGSQGETGGDALDPSTVGQNWPLIGGRSTYAGGNNPMTYSGKYTYSYVPTMLTDYPAIGHDRRYDNLGVNGASGLFFDTRAIGADWRFVGEQLSIMSLPLDYGTRINAGILGFGLGAAALPKTLYQMAKPNGYVEMMMWYYISNYGVTNRPGN